jgi:hypothetical protein
VPAQEDHPLVRQRCQQLAARRTPGLPLYVTRGFELSRDSITNWDRSDSSAGQENSGVPGVH